MAKAGLSGQSRPKPAKAGVGVNRLFPGQRRSRLTPASAGSFRGAQRKEPAYKAGVSRLLFGQKPALSGRRSRLSGQKEAGFRPKAGSCREEAGFWPKAGSFFWPKAGFFFGQRSRLFWPKAGFLYIYNKARRAVGLIILRPVGPLALYYTIKARRAVGLSITEARRASFGQRSRLLAKGSRLLLAKEAGFWPRRSRLTPAKSRLLPGQRSRLTPALPAPSARKKPAYTGQSRLLLGQEAGQSRPKPASFVRRL